MEVRARCVGAGESPLPEVVIGAAWDDPEADLLAFDRRVHAAEGAGPFELVIRTRRPREALLRYQRLLPLPGDLASRDPRLAEAVARHRALHDLTRPLVRADHDHAHDVRRWVLRLAPAASLELQLAALFHDVERLESEADQRVEHRAVDYQRFKDAHARRGAEIVAEVLDGVLPVASIERTCSLVSGHERARADEEAAILQDADALSFFALNCVGYLRWFGPGQTRRKVVWTLGRLRRCARSWLHEIRVPPFVAAVLRDEEASPAG